LKITSLFISKCEEEIPVLAEFCKKNSIQLNAQSFLRFQQLPFITPKDFEIVFFGSSRAAKYFLAQTEIDSQAKIAVAGNTTKAYLEKLGYKVHFCPTASGNITQSAKEFAEWAKGRTVVFPISNISNKSYTQFLSKENSIELQVYSTEIHSFALAPVDCYVFTSPSNVRGFFSSNKPPQSAKIIAYGESTAKTLREYSVENVTILKDSSENGVIEVLLNKIQSI